MKTLKNKVLQYDKFFDVKGLVEEFKEFARPKAIKHRMMDKQKIVEKQKEKQEVSYVSGRKRILRYKTKICSIILLDVFLL